MKPIIRKALKAVLTVVLAVSFLLCLSEAETASLQLALSGGALLSVVLSYKGLEALGTFDKYND